jgi:hypothetical protein
MAFGVSTAAASEAFATSTAYLASLVCHIVFKKQGQKSGLDDSVEGTYVTNATGDPYNSARMLP